MADNAYGYDLFIVNSSEDSDKATELMMDLENRFNLKCCFADREFVPGTEIIENITNFMDKSDKILVLLSPASVKSGWCWQELQEASSKRARERRHCIIPVLLEYTKVPKLMRDVTYIDFQKEKDPSEKIYKAFRHRTESFFEVVPLESKEASISGDSGFLDFLHEIPCTYDDDFGDDKERMEFLEEEANVLTLQNYFDNAARNRDLELCQCILKNNYTALSSKNILNFCMHFSKEQFNPELVKALFQKRQGDLSLADLKKSYLVACSREVPCLVTEFNKLGCMKLVNAPFVEKIIPWITVQDDTFLNILKEMKWNNDDMLPFLDVAIQSRNPAVIKVLLTFISTIPFEVFDEMIFVSDEETCIEVLRKGMYKDIDDKNLRAALNRACMKDMKNLAKEIVKLGVKLQPNFFDTVFNFEIVHVLIQEYPWNLKELQGIQKIVKNQPKCSRLLQTEIQKHLSTQTDNCSILY